MINQLQTQGLGNAVTSWIGEGPNAPVTPQQMHQAFGEQTINELAAKAGLTPQELAKKLAQVLPHAVNAATPGGVVPPASSTTPPLR